MGGDLFGNQGGNFQPNNRNSGDLFGNPSRVTNPNRKPAKESPFSVHKIHEIVNQEYYVHDQEMDKKHIESLRAKMQKIVQPSAADKSVTNQKKTVTNQKKMVTNQDVQRTKKEMEEILSDPYYMHDPA